jgi:uncharacterized membrane protein
MPPAYQLHAAIVHFPIALWITTFFIDIVSLMLKRDNWRGLILLLYWLAAFGMVGAYFSGEAAEKTVIYAADSVHEQVKLHEQIGTVAMVLALVYALVRSLASAGGTVGKILPFVRKTDENARKWQLGFIAAGAIIAALIAFTGKIGGELVYHEGLNVQPYQAILAEELGLELEAPTALNGEE